MSVINRFKTPFSKHQLCNEKQHKYIITLKYYEQAIQNKNIFQYIYFIVSQHLSNFNTICKIYNFYYKSKLYKKGMPLQQGHSFFIF